MPAVYRMQAALLPSEASAPTAATAPTPPTAPAAPPTDVLVQLLQLFFAFQTPDPEDRVPVAMEDGRLYQFRPHYFLGDVTNNFLGGRISLALTHEQKRAIFELEWFSPWLDKVIRIRAEKHNC